MKKIENYKTEMSRIYPDRKFVESTLDSIKSNRHTSKINKMQVLKTVGGIGLTAAVLCGAVIGGGAVRSLFDSIEPIDTDPVETTTSPIIEETITEPDITGSDNSPVIATDSELLATPLASNPKYTVRVTTPDGKVALDENTEIKTLMACGVPLVGDNGIIGMQYLCESFRKNMYGDSFEFILADKYKKNMGINYSYMKVSDYNVSLTKYYDHVGCLSITTYDNYPSSYFAHHAGYRREMDYNNNELVGYELSSHNTGIDLYENIGVISLYRLFEATGGNIDLYKAEIYDLLSQEGEYNSPILSLIYNGECKGAFRMNKFLENIKNGEEYAGVQFTDISLCDDYLERFYSVEYADGVYSVFTMTDGIFGEFDTQYFDGCTVVGNTAVFDNGNVRYTFPLSETPEEDIAEYADHKFFIEAYDYVWSGTQIDKYYSVNWEWVNKKLKDFDVTEYLVEEESLSGNGKVAYKIDHFRKNEKYGNAYIEFKVYVPTLVTKYPFTSSTGIPCRVETVTLDIPIEDCEIVPYKETAGGNFNACLLDEGFFSGTHFYTYTEIKNYQQENDYVCLMHLNYTALTEGILS